MDRMTFRRLMDNQGAAKNHRRYVERTDLRADSVALLALTVLHCSRGIIPSLML
jgi:hypothetical protein